MVIMCHKHIEQAISGMDLNSVNVDSGVLAKVGTVSLINSLASLNILKLI